MHILIISQGPIPLIGFSSIFSSHNSFVDARERLMYVSEIKEKNTRGRTGNELIRHSLRKLLRFHPGNKRLKGCFLYVTWKEHMKILNVCLRIKHVPKSDEICTETTLLLKYIRILCFSCTTESLQR